MIRLDNRRVLVTGASKGVGAAVAAALGRAGARVVAHYGGDRAGAEEALAGVPGTHKRFVQADLHDLDATEALWDAAQSAWDGIDVYVNNAAVMLWHGGFESDKATWDAVWNDTLAVNVLAPARLMRRAVKHFRASRAGVLVTISSWAAQRGVTNPDTIAYAASKAAVRAATQTIARAYASEGLLAYIVAPGVVRTQMSEAFAATQGGEERINSTLAMGEWVPPQELGELVAFLASGRQRHLSGATLDVNGATYLR